MYETHVVAFNNWGYVFLKSDEVSDLTVPKFVYITKEIGIKGNQ